MQRLRAITTFVLAAAQGSFSHSIPHELVVTVFIMTERDFLYRNMQEQRTERMKKLLGSKSGNRVSKNNEMYYRHTHTHTE